MNRIFLAVLLAIANLGLAYAAGLDDGYAGLAAARRGEYGEAIRHYSDALAAGDLSPYNMVAVYHNRGNAYQHDGRYQEAIADYTSAISIRPEYAQAYFGRGRARFNSAEFTAAATDFAQSVTLDPSDAYSVLWLHLAQSNAIMANADELLRNSDKVDLGEWPGPLINLYLGKATTEQTRAASTRTSPNPQNDQDCEAAFFLGEYEFLRKNLATARTLFQEAVTTCSSGTDEHDGAIAELKRLL